eukprot:5907775-Pyramimonas_sp.AAC.1
MIPTHVDGHALLSGDTAANVADVLLVVGAVVLVELVCRSHCREHLDVLLELGVLSLVARVEQVGLHRRLDRVNSLGFCRAQLMTSQSYW